MDAASVRDRIEGLVEEEHQLLRKDGEEGFDQDRHARLEAIQAELDSCWDMLRRRQAGQAERLADADVPDPPNDLEGPEPEPTHLEHGVHGEGPNPDPGINPNAP
jgi:Protein of unknown function (DUF2630)